MKHVVHVSDIKAYKSCARQARFSSMVWQGLEPTGIYAPFFIGRAVHSALEFYYSGVRFEDAVKMALSVESEMATGLEDDKAAWVVEEHIETITSLLEHYYHWATTYDHPWADKHLQFLDVEPAFRIPFTELFPNRARVPQDMAVGGRFDGIVRRKSDGTLWLLETKTAASITQLQNHLPFDEQAGIYILAAEHLLGEHFQGVMYNIIRKKVPTQPQVLKAGGLSKRAIDTTPEVYLSAAREAHPDLEDNELRIMYADVLGDLGKNPFFSRTIVRRTPQEIETIGRDLVKIAYRMRNERAFLPSPEMVKCSRCPFREPCLALTRGETFSYEAYQPRTDRLYRPVRAYGYYIIPIREDRYTAWKDGERIIAATTSEAALSAVSRHAEIHNPRIARDLQLEELWQDA